MRALFPLRSALLGSPPVCGFPAAAQTGLWASVQHRSQDAPAGEAEDPGPGVLPPWPHSLQMPGHQQVPATGSSWASSFGVGNDTSVVFRHQSTLVSLTARGWEPPLCLPGVQLCPPPRCLAFSSFSVPGGLPVFIFT